MLKYSSSANIFQKKMSISKLLTIQTEREERERERKRVKERERKRDREREKGEERELFFKLT